MARARSSWRATRPRASVVMSASRRLTSATRRSRRAACGAPRSSSRRATTVAWWGRCSRVSRARSAAAAAARFSRALAPLSRAWWTEDDDHEREQGRRGQRSHRLQDPARATREAVGALEVRAPAGGTVLLARLGPVRRSAGTPAAAPRGSERRSRARPRACGRERPPRDPRPTSGPSLGPCASRRGEHTRATASSRRAPGPTCATRRSTSSATPTPGSSPCALPRRRRAARGHRRGRSAAGVSAAAHRSSASTCASVSPAAGSVVTSRVRAGRARPSPGMTRRGRRRSTPAAGRPRGPRSRRASSAGLRLLSRGR